MTPPEQRSAEALTHPGDCPVTLPYNHHRGIPGCVADPHAGHQVDSNGFCDDCLAWTDAEYAEQAAATEPAAPDTQYANVQPDETAGGGEPVGYDPQQDQWIHANDAGSGAVECGHDWTASTAYQIAPGIPGSVCAKCNARPEPATPDTERLPPICAECGGTEPPVVGVPLHPTCAAAPDTERELPPLPEFVDVGTEEGRRQLMDALVPSGVMTEAAQAGPPPLDVPTLADAIHVVEPCQNPSLREEWPLFCPCMKRAQRFAAVAARLSRTGEPDR